MSMLSSRPIRIIRTPLLQIVPLQAARASPDHGRARSGNPLRCHTHTPLMCWSGSIDPIIPRAMVLREEGGKGRRANPCLRNRWIGCDASLFPFWGVCGRVKGVSRKRTSLARFEASVDQPEPHLESPNSPLYVASLSQHLRSPSHNFTCEPFPPNSRPNRKALLPASGRRVPSRVITAAASLVTAGQGRRVKKKPKCHFTHFHVPIEPHIASAGNTFSLQLIKFGSNNGCAILIIPAGLAESESMQSSLEPVQTLRCHDPLDAGAIGVSGLHSLTRSRLNKSLAKRKSSDYLLEAPQRHRLKGTRKPSAAPREYPLPESLVQFTILDHSNKTAFEFSLDAQWGCRGIKRCRLGSDVEGPNTANIGRKKRRLRTHLITSRLSQPFSQPATHILNREGRQVGDRRFVKMAVMLDSSRRAAYLRATAYLRYSIMNRMRKRLGVVRYQGSTKESEDSTVRPSTDTFAKAPWQPQEVKSSQEMKSSPQPSPSVPEPSKGATPTSRELKDETSIQSAETLGKAPAACRLSKPIALPLPSADVDATNDRTSARIDSTTSPEPRPPLAWMYDDAEEDSFAFLHLDEEHLDDDDSDVYCDFDAIFAAKAASPGPQSPSEEHTYEEYIDELDGISWRIG